MLTVLLACATTPASSSTDAGPLADVTDVSTSGDAGAYTFSVTILSPDIGCERYADWWEVLSTEGELRYRRILTHSHVDEQPFTRSGSPVPVAADEEVIVRSHLSPDGYGGAAMQGSVAGGFAPVTLTAGFAAEAEQAEPLPDGCAF